jgi:hypothetical protein
LYSILSSFSFVGRTGSSSEGITLWYRVDSEGSYAQRLQNFTGDTIDCLREAVKIKSDLTHPTYRLKLVAAGSDDSEIDLEGMQDLVDGSGSFDFNKLLSLYSIDYFNPIRVKFPGK